MFTAKTLSFLRSLKRNNNRDWFRARKSDYEQHVRAPMIAIIERLARDFAAFAPELDASPRKCLYRIYRDTRFSEDKTPLKTNVAASFRWKTLPRGEGAGLYFEVGPGWVWMGGGLYAPEASDLVRIRQHISDTYPELHQLTRAAAFRRAVGALDGERLKRLPRGYVRDDPACDYLKYRGFLAGREFPPEFATSRRFYLTLVRTFRAVMPLVRFLNEPLVEDKRDAPTESAPVGNHAFRSAFSRGNERVDVLPALLESPTTNLLKLFRHSGDDSHVRGGRCVRSEVNTDRLIRVTRRA